MNKSFIIVLASTRDGTIQFVGQKYTIVGSQHKAYHFTSQVEAGQAAEHFCQEVHHVIPGEEKTYPFNYLVLTV